MAAMSLVNASFRTLPHQTFVSPGVIGGSSLYSGSKQSPWICGNYSSNKRKFTLSSSCLCKPRTVVFCSLGESGETSTDVLGEGDGNVLEVCEEDKTAPRKALSEALFRQEALEKERDQLLEELARSKTKQQEYMATIMHDKELAVAELEAAKALFHQKMQESVDEKLSLESRLVLAKEDAVELAVQVEKLAEIAFQQATSHILDDAQLKVMAAETSAAETAYRVEEDIRKATEGTIISIVKQSKDAIEKALSIADAACDHTTKAMSALTDSIVPADDFASIRSQNIELQTVVNDLESQLLVTKNEVGKLVLELQQAREQGKSFELRANMAEEALIKFQESSKETARQQEEEMKSLMEKLKRDAVERRKAATKAFKVDLEAIKGALEASKEVVCSKDEAYTRRCEALQRSLKAAESAKKMWKERAELAESVIVKGRRIEERNEDAIFVVNGGRIDLLTDDDSQKWKLLTDGPRREIPDWMARRISSICPKFPPRKTTISEAKTSKFKFLDLPNPNEVWSIAEAKPKDGDTLIEHVIEKAVIEKKRKALERALQRKTVQWQKTPEETKLEPGTGSGREIVFQAFNWESWRRRWYLDLAPKAADLSHCGITAVWLPPPTESVAPQGYMPSDLYNLNSAYGTQEELKYCIEEMHSQDLLALGDVVLNHRCAHKQSPNGVWNIFGGKLAWGPEAIVCDDPNFQGRGNPSSGDIFHAAPNIDHSQGFVRKDVKEWLNWLRNDIGYDGWRLDFVRGFSGGYVKEYIEASNPAFAIGEYWDSLAYEGGDLCYNQDAHRQRIINWINATGGTSSAFDVTTKGPDAMGAFGLLQPPADGFKLIIKEPISPSSANFSLFRMAPGILHSALHNQYWRLIDPQGKPTGVMGWWPSRAVTFLENHDTGSTQGHWPFPRDKLMQGYAYILTHPGTPAIFYDHFYDFGIHDVITELIEARKRAGIHCRSPVKILHANNNGYVAQIGDALVMKLGQFDWNPSKEVHLDGSWQKFVDKGPDYQLWLRL